MRKLLSLLATALLVLSLASCSDDTTKPTSSQNDGKIHGQITGNDFEYDVTPGDPGSGPFVLRGRNLHYNDDNGSLVVDLSVFNRGDVAQTEPIGLTFLRLDPDGVTVLNPDNNIHDDGAAIMFHFANDDGVWTPGEASLPRTVEFGVDKGTAIAFVARLDLGAPVESGNISGRVWNDTNKDGHMDDNEGGIPGVAVYLYQFSTDENTPRSPDWQMNTDANGEYGFRGLNAGGYVVSIAPSNINLFPTTAAEIHVLLTNNGAEVSSYKNANFGAVRQDVPPPGISQHLRAVGKFLAPDHFAAVHTENFTCIDSIPVPLFKDPPVSDACNGGTLRGSVTEVAPERGAIRVMATWVNLGAINIPLDFKVGDRVDVHVRPGPGPLSWVADSIMPYTGDPDEIIGPIEAIERSPDGTVRERVLDTWIAVPGTNG